MKYCGSLEKSAMIGLGRIRECFMKDVACELVLKEKVECGCAEIWGSIPCPHMLVFSNLFKQFQGHDHVNLPWVHNLVMMWLPLH